MQAQKEEEFLELNPTMWGRAHFDHQIPDCWIAWCNNCRGWKTVSSRWTVVRGLLVEHLMGHLVKGDSIV